MFATLEQIKLEDVLYTSSANTCTEVSEQMKQHDGSKHKVYTMFMNKVRTRVDKHGIKNGKEVH